MTLYILKVIISVVTIIGVTEISRRAGTFWGGILASLPLTSLLVFVWLYLEEKNTEVVASLSWNIFWMVLPSLTLFVSFPILLRRGLSFPLALILGLIIMAAAYLVTGAIVRRYGIQI